MAGCPPTTALTILGIIVKTSLLARFSVAAAVAALTLVGTAVPADADTASIQVTGIALQPTATYAPTVGLIGNVDITFDPSVDITSAKTDVVVNNKTVAVGVPLYSDGIDYQRAWGAGVVRLANVKVTGTDQDGTVPFEDLALSTPYNATRVRYAVDPGTVIKINRVNKKLSFKVRATYTAANGKHYSVGKAKIQYKKNGAWKTLKTLKLNSTGRATYKITTSKKRPYRLVIATTNVFQGAATPATKKI